MVIPRPWARLMRDRGHPDAISGCDPWCHHLERSHPLDVLLILRHEIAQVLNQRWANLCLPAAIERVFLEIGYGELRLVEYPHGRHD